jgi:predicted HicB family RNase H-like nuclease
MSTPAVESESAKVTIRIDPLTRRRLVAAAERDRRPISSLARRLLQDALRDRDQEASHDDGD